MKPHTAKELLALESKAASFGKDSDIYKVFMLFRYTGCHASVLATKAANLHEEIDEEKDTIIVWNRPKKTGAAARTAILKHTRIELDVTEYAQCLYGRRSKNYREYFYRLMRKLGIAAEIPDVSPHSLRHSLAIELLNDGWSESTVAQLLNIDRKTLKWYGRYTDTGLKKKLKKKGW